MTYRIILISLICILNTHPLTAKEDKTATWHVAGLIRSTPEDNIVLRDNRDRVLKTFSSSQLRNIYAAIVALEEAAELRVELFLMGGDDPNAFATVAKIDTEKGQILEPDSKIGEDINLVVVNFALLDMVKDDYDMAAAILGHEIAHIKLNHVEDARKARDKNPEGIMTAANTRYSRDNERDADYLGVIWSIESGYDPNGVVRAQEALYNHYKRKGGTFGSSHPSSIERITVLKSLVRRLSR